MAKSALSSACALALLAPFFASAQSFPSKPIRLIVPYAAGGSPDITSRLVANELTQQLGQQVVVDNRVGAAGIIGTEMIARAAPDGYTLGYVAFSFSTNPSLYAKLPYDMQRDFQPVVAMLYSVNLLAVAPSLPIRSAKDLVEYARANPDKLSYGITGGGTSVTLAMELLKVMTNTKLVPVTYKATQQAIIDVASGRVDAFCDNMASILPHAKAGRVRGIGVTSLKRSSALPDIPTIDESGVPGFEITPWSGYMFPLRAPRTIVMRMNAEINKALLSQSVQEKFTAFGYGTGGGTPEQFGEFMLKERDKWAKVIKAAGLKLQ